MFHIARLGAQEFSTKSSVVIAITMASYHQAYSLFAIDGQSIDEGAKFVYASQRGKK